MKLFKSSMLVCPRDRHCSEWAQKYMEYCLCSAKDGVSLTLGLISVISWGVAEIPQLITNYKEKSTEGLSLIFLLTWLLGDLFNLGGCMLEPATLPTQYYTAVLYTITTAILTGQSIYYVHIYPRLKYRLLKGPKPKQTGRQTNSSAVKQVNKDEQSNGSDTSSRGNASSSPIPFPAVPQISSGRELYYMSARSLTKSHTPTAGSVLAQRMTPTFHHIGNAIEEPLLGEPISTQSEPALKIKTTLCLVSSVTFLGAFSVHQSADRRLDSVVLNAKQGIVLQAGRKLSQVSEVLLQENSIAGSSGIGSFLGWTMTAIYLGGRLPQIILNIRRGNVEGLNPLMFIFALVGNATYVASILVSSLDWSKVRPNLPWLVDAGGCVLLDTFILIQFIYFRHGASEDIRSKHEYDNAA
ncbi:PQ-loop repeat family protein / transmembrane family protein [Quillaja saponaria]|uniref:PQ-loop repeat family protein / transmembrane family protein n=1 Tax=Quillaja saponaria TaxID=32244 RepID=A0AAD7Q7Y9_QUISA|nr:PQ-loop repeat family protein / transmembrane family protein [Quillaja saponaria]